MTRLLYLLISYQSPVLTPCRAVGSPHQVSKAGGTNPFCVTRQVVSMRALVKALDLITLAGTEEQTAAHGLRAVVRRSNALITNTRRNSEAEEAKETIQPFLVAVDLAQIVIR